MITLDRICKTYQTRQGPRKVLENISLRLGRGQNLGIIGRNGAGKSTLIRIIAGAEHPTSGCVYRGMTVSWPLAFAGAFQPNLTGLDNLKFVCRIYNVDYKQLIAFVEDFTELGAYFREPVVHYSSGMLMRLAFALSMAIEFECFLIDEVIAVGDSRFHDRCHVELFEKRRDRSFIFVSHDPNVIRQHCQRAAVLHKGTLQTFETVDEAYSFYETASI